MNGRRGPGRFARLGLRSALGGKNVAAAEETASKQAEERQYLVAAVQAGRLFQQFHFHLQQACFVPAAETAAKQIGERLALVVRESVEERKRDKLEAATRQRAS